MLDAGSRQSRVVPGVMEAYRGRPSVLYSAALRGAYHSDIIGYTLHTV